jgi:hypothetical protein
MEKWKIFTLPGLEFWPLDHPVCSQLLYQLHYQLELELELEFFLRPTVSRPVSLGIGPPFGTLDQILSCSSSFVWQLRYSAFNASSLTRKRVCSLQCNHPLVRSVTPNNHTLPPHLRLFPFCRLLRLAGTTRLLYAYLNMNWDQWRALVKTVMNLGCRRNLRVWCMYEIMLVYAFVVKSQINSNNDSDVWKLSKHRIIHSYLKLNSGHKTEKTRHHMLWRASRRLVMNRIFWWTLLTPLYRA